MPRVAWLIGPALVAGVAYLDPGNVASNMTAGAQYGYLLVWVVVLGNVMAWLIQYLSAKLGIVTGRSLPEVLGGRLRNAWGRRAYWLQAELVAMATDLAEVIGGAVALNLLFGIPLIWGGVITGTVSIGLLVLQSRRGPRTFEFVIMGLLAIIAIGFTVGVFIAPPDPGGLFAGLVPRFEDTNSVLLAASILGATIMPHAIYAHSALSRDRFATPGLQAGGAAEARAGGAADGPQAATSARGIRSWFRVTRGTDRAELLPGSATHLPTDTLLRATRIDVTVAMAIAGTVNLCILLLAAVNLAGVAGTDSLEGAYAALELSLGPVIATLFAIGLLASGLASTSVGAYAGAEIMHGLLRVRIPLIFRRLVTLVPALAILALGFDPTLSLVLSQVVLSFGIPFALVPLVALTAKRGLLGRWRNHWATTAAGVAASIFLITLNGLLLWLVFTGA
ncbi:Nramp family divalent metal transporter [Agromyces aerolatus]|uniref:Nramp family divalent metal transporter n=1 Tax=Agromyces sp. LY-1074 TaxID=3074080 RepID=UPI0028576C79|nr:MULTISPECIES: Nramp family divalent metal transporter [unclassified Agromyces]MDR5701711.1 Nramp family divalent metal transporter [Agromyces sp. LY-1074]MDR5707942.1 Nramp family divalent metal transporter [Agromyces sp. LY-1358]